jgi:hypothetical protein
MSNDGTKSLALQSEAAAVDLLDDWFDTIEAGSRERVRELIQAMIESELEATLSRPRYAPRAMLAGPRRLPRMLMARAVSLATGRATDRARCWGASAGSRSRCRGPGLTPRRARPPSGRG